MKMLVAGKFKPGAISIEKDEAQVMHFAVVLPVLEQLGESPTPEQILALKDRLRAAGKRCGLIATSNENLLERQRQGFQMLGLGMDAGLLLRSLHGALAAVGRDRVLKASLTVSSAGEKT